MPNHFGEILDLIDELSKTPQNVSLRYGQLFRGVRTSAGSIVVNYYGSDFDLMPRVIKHLQASGQMAMGTYSRLTLYLGPSR